MAITPQQQYHMPPQQHLPYIPPRGRGRGGCSRGVGRVQVNFMQGYGKSVAHLHTNMPQWPQQTMVPSHMMPQV